MILSARARILNLVRRIMSEVANCMSGTCTKFRNRYRTSTLKYLTYTVKHYLIVVLNVAASGLGLL